MNLDFTKLFALIFTAILIALGIWMGRKGKYPAFYFSVSGLFLLECISVCLLFSRSMTSNITVEYNGEIDSSGSASSFDLLALIYPLAICTYFLIFPTSIINLFIRKNKTSVKIVSGVVVTLCTLIAFAIYAIAHLLPGKFGG